MGVVIQFLCSYVTLPLYALVTQMGSSMRPTVFNEGVATALRKWHQTAKKHTKRGKHSESHTPMSSRPATPTHGMSPVHLLHNYRGSTAPNSLQASPRISNYDHNHWDPEAANSVHDHDVYEPRFIGSPDPDSSEQHTPVQNPNVSQLPPGGPGSIRTRHEINIGLADFTFRK
uniref:Uncharacterized protein MANES_10G044600 n=1 Tax=Rhizophora mucronata TaxID=61149 RepID=A0A2P2N3Q4_RHIMU